MHLLRPRILSLPIVLVAAGLVACEAGPGPTANPRSPDLAPAVVSVNGVQLLGAGSGRSMTLASGAMETMTPGSGGRVQAGSGRLIVPPGALEKATTITMEALEGLEGFAFGPDGLRFREPATLTISIDVAALRDAGIEPAELAIAGASDEADDWRMLGGSYDPASETVTVGLSHFSRYSLCIR